MIKLTEKQIEEIADYLDSGLICLYNKKTKELITITEFDDYPDSDELNWDDILEFERMNSNDSFDLMIYFVEQLNDCLLKEKLINVLNKSKPFKNFKFQIDNSDEYRQKWFDFKNRSYVEYVKLQLETINENENSDFGIAEKIDCEEWGAETDFFDREDWENLLEFQKRKAEKDPTNLQYQEKYAIALNLNEKFEETLKLLEPLYRKNYESGFGINEIMVALLGLNKTEKDFKWIKKPLILKLDEETIKLCIEFLKSKRTPISVSDIYSYLIVKSDFIYFDEISLAKYLANFTYLFDLNDYSSDFLNMQIKLKKKK